MAGEGEQYDTDSTLKVPEATRVRTVSALEDTKPHHLRSPMSREDDVKHGSTQKSFENGHCQGVSRDTENDKKPKNPAKASRIQVRHLALKYLVNYDQSGLTFDTLLNVHYNI